jgi:pimeloyl-ACP methyl ester carboxylesterase
VTDKTHLHASDLHGFSRLAFDATLGLTDLVEAMHHTVARVPKPFGKPVKGRPAGITGFVYRIVRGVIGALGGGADKLLEQLVPAFARKRSTPEREAVLAALNGVLGDHLAETGNPLAIPMSLRREGVPLALERVQLAAALPQAQPRLLVLVHGLCMNDLQWSRNGHDHGRSLAGDAGFTPLYLHYNTGLHISVNGRSFAEQLEALVREWPVPVEEVVILAHSMGGLVTRSACHYGKAADHAWLARLTKIFFLGTPHQGAPLERGGNWVNLVLDASPYTAPFSRLGRIRSAGITDLRHGAILDEDWKARDRFAHSRAPRRTLALPEGVACFAIAATTGKRAGDLGDRLLGDGLVPVASAFGRARGSGKGRESPFPESRQWLGAGMNHLDLLERREVCDRLRSWLARDP